VGCGCGRPLPTPADRNLADRLLGCQRYVQARNELGGAPAGRGTAVDGHQRTGARLIAGRLRGLASDEIGGPSAGSAR
jgi:hypothetical protein